MIKMLTKLSVEWYEWNSGRASQGMPTKNTPARITCLDFKLQKTKM
jgi:T-complex protein 1 subunit alpha